MARSATAGLNALVVALLTVALVAVPAPSASARPDAIAHAGRWLTDGDGRVVIVHGVNVPTKWNATYPAAIGFDDEDAALLAGAGLNAVRLTVERYAVEPSPGAFNDTYLTHMADTVRMLDAHGIRALIDFHVDEWGPHFFDNGFPEWMTMTDGLPNVYQVGFPFQYFLNPALNRAYDHFWNNDIGPTGRRLQEEDADILRHVVAYMADLPGLLGYEIINEPWPGTVYPTCVLPVLGCPVFDRRKLSAYYARVIPAMRAADPHHLIWYEPLTIFNDGVPTWVKPPRDAALGFAFHDYPITCVQGVPCAPFDKLVLRHAEAHSARTGSALLETEFGNTFDVPRLNEQLDALDQFRMPWLFWSYNHFVVPEGAGGALAAATPANVVAPVLDALARPYPRLIAGTPVAWAYDPATHTFTLSYATARAGGHGRFPSGSATEISVPHQLYPSGYHVSVAGATVTSSAGAAVLRLRSAPGAVRVTVNVTQ